LQSVERKNTTVLKTGEKKQTYRPSVTKTRHADSEHVVSHCNVIPADEFCPSFMLLFYCTLLHVIGEKKQKKQSGIQHCIAEIPAFLLTF